MRLRIVSLNVWALPWPVGHRVAERMEAIGAQLPDFSADVAAFQEVWTPGAREILVAAGRRAGLGHAWHREEILGGSGLLVLSRRPAESVHFERYALRGLPQRLAHGDYHGGKGFVELRLATPGGSVALVDTHLHARYAPVGQDDYRGHRMGQVVQLAARLQEIETPVVAVGDFNFGDERPEYRVLAGLTGLVDVAASLERRRPTRRGDHPVAPSPDGDSRIDYVFTRDGSRAGAVPRRIERIFDAWRPGGPGPVADSDHDGLLAEIELLPGGGRPLAPVDREAVAAADEILRRGRAAARSRRREQRAAAGVGVGVSGLALASARRARASRRRFLGTSLVGVGALALPAGLSLAALSELAGPAELDAFDEALATLRKLGAAARVP